MGRRPIVLQVDGGGRGIEGASTVAAMLSAGGAARRVKGVGAWLRKGLRGEERLFWLKRGMAG